MGLRAAVILVNQMDNVGWTVRFNRIVNAQKLPKDVIVSLKSRASISIARITASV